MAKDDVLVVNATQMKTRQRKPGGKTSTYAVTTTVTSEPITINLDEKHVAIATAIAIADQARAQTRAIAEPASEETLKARKVAERAFDRGESWARRRYSGGRLGVTPPVHGEVRRFNHSGRLAKGIVARYREKQKDFVINYPANRWNPKDWRSLAALEVAFNRWVDKIPVLKDPRNDLTVQRALRDMAADTGKKHPMGTAPDAAIRAHVAEAQVEDNSLEQALIASLELLEAVVA